MVTYLLPTSEVRGSNRRPYVVKLVVAYRWSIVYITELYVLVSSFQQTIDREMTCTLLKTT